MKTKQTFSQKLSRGIAKTAMGIGIIVIASIGITCVVCLVICITDLIKQIIA